MKLAEAQAFAALVKEHLAPFCDRIEIAGSIRRCKEDIGDVEIVCIPKKGAQRSRKNGEFMPVMGYIQAVNQWLKRKGDPWGKHTQRWAVIGDQGMKVDIFTANELNWGYIYAIRTGSAEYSHKVLATNWVIAGYHGHEGFLRDKKDIIVPVREEVDLFNLIGVPWCEPVDRNL